MSKIFSVVVLCPNGRREVVKVSPNYSILQILEEACKKQNIIAEDYDIRHYNKTLDLSLPVRFANLPNNAQLELCQAEKSRKDSLVTIGLQLESGERLMAEYPPSATIKNILERSLNSDSCTKNEGKEPVCIYMRQKITGDALQSTTLRSLGLTKGTAMIRLLYRNPEEFEDQAHVSSPLTATVSKGGAAYSQAIEDPVPVSTDVERVKKHPRLDMSNEKKDYILKAEFPKKEEERVPMEVDVEEDQEKTVPAPRIMEVGESELIKNTELELNPTEKAESAEETQMDYNIEVEEDTFEGMKDIKYIGERHAVIYSLDDITDVKKADLPDEFFDLTINDAKYLMTDYRNQRDQWENQPLLTKELRQNQMLQQFSRYSQTVVRVNFPERLVLQAVFNVNETVQAISDFLRVYLKDDNLKFYLYITPPKEKLNPNKTLLEAVLVPAAVVYFGCDISKQSFLAENLRSKLSDPRAAALAAYESRKAGESSKTSYHDQPSVNSGIVVEEKQSNMTTILHQSPNDNKKLPKWLKLGKK